MDFRLKAVGDGGLWYLTFTSLGLGPITVGTRQFRLQLDEVFVFSMMCPNPNPFVNYQGWIDLNGEARATLMIPAVPQIVGTTLYTAFATALPSAPQGIQSMSNTFSFTVQP